ncbi:MAG: glycosyl hydrolase family 18 protein [Dehalococcoidia bacterium]
MRSRGGRDPAPLIIGGTVLFVAVVIIVVFLVSGVLGGGGDDEGNSLVEGQGIRGEIGEMPGLPPGLLALSDFVVFETEGDVTAEVALPLTTQPEDETGLGFYTFRDERWQRTVDAELIEGGARAQASFDPVPENLAVLRVVAQAYQVAGSVPSGGALHPDAGLGIINPRDFEPLADGSLAGTATELEAPEGTLVIPTIIGSSEETASQVNDLLEDDTRRDQHVQEIVQLAEGGDYAGIDLEYSSVDPELRDEFTSFAEALGRQLRDDGRRLSLTLPPPAPQRQAYDYEKLGDAADIIKILPIADPMEYWDTLPGVLDDLVETVDPEKLMLVVSPFSSQIQDEQATPLGYLQAMLLASEIRVREPEDPEAIEPDVGVNLVAVNLAQSEGAEELAWNNDAAALTFAYGGTDKKTVYIENVFSVGFKLEMVQTYALGGVAISDASAGTDVANVWPVVNQLLEAGTVSLVRPNDDALVPRWESPDGGQLDAAAGAQVIWRAEEPGTYKLRMLISDGDLRFGRELDIEVNEAEEEEPEPLVTFGPEDTPTVTPTATPTPEPGEEPTPTQLPDAPPSRPTGLEADDSTPCQIKLTWDEPPEPDVVGYNVYGSITSGGPYEKLNDSLVPSKVFTDDDFPDCAEDQGNKYYYVVRAVDDGGNEGPPSLQVEATLSGPDD